MTLLSISLMFQIIGTTLYYLKMCLPLPLSSTHLLVVLRYAGNLYYFADLTSSGFGIADFPFGVLQETRNVVFHVLTDAQNFYAMKHWFSRNAYRESAVNVINYEHIILENLPEFSMQQLYMPEEFRVFISSFDRPTEKSRMEYLSVFSHSHFFIPEIFKDLKKVIVLDDDVIVQRDLSFLWNLDMGDKVNAAVKFCGLRLGQLRNLLGEAMYDPQSCAWMSGLNVINLEKWREYNVTENYLQLLEKVGLLSARFYFKF